MSAGTGSGRRQSWARIRLAGKLLARILLRRVRPLLVILCILAPIGYLYTPWEQGYRDDAIPVLQAQLDALAPTSQNTAATRNVSTDPIRGPSIIVDYRRFEECDAVQSRYQQVAASVGWATGAASAAVPEYERGYHKTVSGYYIELVVDCEDTIPNDYVILIHVPFPQDITIIGSWLKG